MKLISIENKVYRIKDNDFIDISMELSNDVISKRFENIEKNYKPILELDDMFNYG